MSPLILVAYCALASPAMPDPKLTPGDADPRVTQATIDKTICVHGYTATVRSVPESERKEVFERYHVTDEPGKYEVDHLISLELGGTNDIKNLWPEPYAPKPGAHEKDVVETNLHKQICNHKISISAAQSIITRDWYAYYKEIKGLK